MHALCDLLDAHAREDAMGDTRQWTCRYTRTRCSRSALRFSATGGIKPLQASMENNTRQGDMADQASGNNEVHMQLKLKQTDAKILQAIEEALWRIDKGTYGVCRDCGEPIRRARLNAIPWTRVCITCKEKQNVVTELARRCCRSSTATSWRRCCGTRRGARLVGAVRRRTTPTSTSSTARRRTVLAGEARSRELGGAAAEVERAGAHAVGQGRDGRASTSSKRTRATRRRSSTAGGRGSRR